MRIDLQAGLVLLGLTLSAVGCASPRGSGHVVWRMWQAEPAQWPRPIPVGEVTGVEITQGALTAAEAASLPLTCQRAAHARLRNVAELRATSAPAMRLVISKLQVDTQTRDDGERMVRARAVMEMRVWDRPLGIATGVAHFATRRPSFRADDVEPAEVARTVQSACARAADAMIKPPPPLSDDRREALHGELRAPAAGTRLGAVTALALNPAPSSADALMGALQDEDPLVRQAAARALGLLAHPSAAEELAHMAEAGDLPALQQEALLAINRVLLIHPELQTRVRAWRAEARARPLAETPPGPDEIDMPSRVLEDAPAGVP